MQDTGIYDIVATVGEREIRACSALENLLCIEQAAKIITGGHVNGRTWFVC